MKPRARGLTLIELLVAIVIFALLGLMSYRAIHSATENQKRLSDEFTDWQRISRTLNRVESELMQIGVRAQGQSSKASALTVTQNANGGSRLVFWRLDNVQGAKLVGLDYADGNLSLLRWKTGDLYQTPTRDVLLSGIDSLHWQFAAKDTSTWADDWPGSTGRNAQAPEGIRLEINLVGKGRITRVFALR